MQTGAYVDQIPAGAKPPTSSPPTVRVTPNAAPLAQRQPPAGLYVLVASAPDQQQAVRAALELAQRLGSAKPPFIRGEAVTVEGRLRLGMYAGPFADEAVAARFCASALPGQVCARRVFAAPRAQNLDAGKTKGPTRVGPQGKGD